MATQTWWPPGAGFHAHGFEIGERKVVALPLADDDVGWRAGDGLQIASSSTACSVASGGGRMVIPAMERTTTPHRRARRRPSQSIWRIALRKLSGDTNSVKRLLSRPSLPTRMTVGSPTTL